MDSLAKMLKYPTEIETPVNTEEVILSMLGYAIGTDGSSKTSLNFKSPRQMDMLNYHTSPEIPAFIDTLRNTLTRQIKVKSEIKGSCSPSSVSFSNDDPIVIPDNITFSISEIQ